MSRRCLVLAAWVVASLGAEAAELPGRAAKPPAKVRVCEIGGEPGIALPDAGCLRISGYVSVGATVGNLKH